MEQQAELVSLDGLMRGGFAPDCEVGLLYEVLRKNRAECRCGPGHVTPPPNRYGTVALLARGLYDISCNLVIISEMEHLVLAILDGDHALYKVGQRLEERGMLPLLHAGLRRESLNDYRLGHILDALFAANLNQVFSAIALKALTLYAIPTPWLHQDTTTIKLYGAYAGLPEARPPEAEEDATPLAPRPAHGSSKDGRPDLKQILLSLGVGGAGALPLRLGIRDGNTSDSTETPVAIEECLALGLPGMIGIVADSKAYSQRT
jgi:transposase